MSDLPEVPEELLVLIPTRAVLGVLEDAAKLGTKAATIYTAGFGEGDDEKGKERAQAMKDLCERTGMVICGPNCMGSYSVAEGLWTFPTATPLLKKGPVGLIFQSGGSLGNWIKGATERGLGFSYAISSGNEVSLDLIDYLSFLVDDPGTKVITLMVEGIRRPQEFMTVAEQALAKGKPILVVKLGRSEMGKRQAISSDDVNAHLREITRRDITAKDFRTWGGTMHAAVALRTTGDREDASSGGHELPVDERRAGVDDVDALELVGAIETRDHIALAR